MKQVGIVFFFEDNDKDVWSGRKIDFDAWNYSCKVAGIKKAIIINKTNVDITTFDADMDIQIVSDMPKLTGHTTQVVCPTDGNGIIDTIDLWDFDHQTDWYIFGPANGWLSDEFFADSFITIPQEGVGYHHGVFIGSTVMFHRYNKLSS